MNVATRHKSYVETAKENSEELIFLLKQSSQEDKRELLGYMRGFFDGKESASRKGEIRAG